MRILIALLISLTFVSGCSQTSSDGSAPKAEKSKPVKGVKAPAGTRLSKVSKGMTDAQVRNIMGNPSNTASYTTGKAWIPFFWGSDTSRTDWKYKGVGRVVFSRNRYSGGLKVVRIDYDPNEKGY